MTFKKWMLSLEQSLCVTTYDSLPGFIPIFFIEYMLSKNPGLKAIGFLQPWYNRVVVEG